MDLPTADFPPSLHDLYLDGATLIIEHLGFHQEGEAWVREEIHRVVGHEPEVWTLRCVGPGDHSDLQGPPRPQDRNCDLCERCKTHTQALHRVHNFDL